MKSKTIPLTVQKAVEHSQVFLQEKGFSIFAVVDHKKNAETVHLELLDATTVIFGNPLGGTKLMQKDINVALDLPLKVSFVTHNNHVDMIFHDSEHYEHTYDVKNHPVLEKINNLFEGLYVHLTTNV